MAEQHAVVGIIMGSDSDWAVMEAAAKQLESMDILHEVDVVSAHRTPDAMVTYARSAADRGLRVIIAGAGGAAHLPGMVASMTSLPVIGVPVPLTTLDGMDSLLSIVQMPTGVPVATVAIGNAANAALLAARIIGSGTSAEDVRVRAALDAHRETMTDEVTRKAEALRARRSTKTGF
jgi:5-(carboxyamino)imidazole ribonucleotide mutase